MLSPIVGLLLGIVVSGSSSRVPPDGVQLLRACGATVRQDDGATLSTEDTVLSLWCLGYVGGFLDGLAIMRWKGGATSVCLPEDGVNNGQAIRIIVKYLRAHPDQLHQTARSSILIAIADAFKC